MAHDDHIGIHDGTLTTHVAPPARRRLCDVSDATGQRPLESGIERDFSQQMSYGEYLQLDTNNQHIWNEYLSETPAGVTNTKGLWILYDGERL